MAKKSKKKTVSKKPTASKNRPRSNKPASPKQAAPKARGDWQSETLARVRALMLEALPGVVEEVKWRKPSNAMQGVPVWSDQGIICTGETYKDKVKLTFARGAAIDDPHGLFNASLDAGTRRAIDIHEGEKINARAFKALVRRAAALNRPAPSDEQPVKRSTKSSPSPKRANAARSTKKAATPVPSAPGEVVLLSGGNPQIAKADGDAPVQAYIAAMPGWKRDVGRRLDQLVEQAVPHVRKAVRWNTPFYGLEGQGWFVAFHCFNKYIKVTFFQGTSLTPPPPEASKQPGVRYFHIQEDQPINEAQMAAWIRQAAVLPGERLFT